MTIGIATLARNAESALPDALRPFLGQVDEIAVLLGGKSTDNTADVAKAYAGKIADYSGPLDEQGGLLDFGLARQQSFDLLTTDWVLAVDTDDVWTGAEKVRAVVKDAAEGDYEAVLFPYDLGGGVRFLQSRLFKRAAGHWVSPVHEQWVYHSAPDVRNLTVNAMTVSQVRPADRLTAVWRNIRIAEAHIEKHGFNYRLLMHLSHEYIITRQYGKSIGAVEEILARKEQFTTELTPERLFQLYYTLTMAHLCLEEYDTAASRIMTALGYVNYGNGWTILAEISYQMGVYDLALCAADKALALGHPVDIIPIPYGNISSVPYFIKAKALNKIGRKHEAITAVNLGLALEKNAEMINLKNQLCEQLGVIP